MKQNLLIRLCVLALALCVCMGPAAALAENVDWSDDDIEYRLLSPIIGAHVGPGMCAIVHIAAEGVERP